MTVVQLGFSEPVASSSFDRAHVGHRSPDFNDWDGGQIGGTPSWLIPRHLPEAVMCRLCRLPMRFVTQLYAPVDFNDDANHGDDDVDRAYHRTLYVFVCLECCMKKDTYTGAVRVLRAQLPRVNPYYPAANADKEVNWKNHLPSTWNTQLCAVCGMPATKKCPLQNRIFCSREHQKEYKSYSKVAHEDDELELSNALPTLFPLSELVVEEEPPIPTGNTSTDRHTNTDSEKPALFPTKGSDEADDDDDDADDSDEDLQQEDLNEMVLGKSKRPSTTQDAITQRFYARLQGPHSVQNQCLRYCRWSIPDSILWIQEKEIPTVIPCCEACGAERKFEFQIMPQMLHYLQGDKKVAHNKNMDSVKDALRQAESWIHQAPPEHIPPALVEAKEKAVGQVQQSLMSQLDWGVIAVYSCKALCRRSIDELHPGLGAYLEEFAWKQPSLDES